MTAAPGEILQAIREVYGWPDGLFLPLHAPVFAGNESAYVQDTITSTFVSSVGRYVDDFEAMLRDITGARHAIAMANGTSALQIALVLAGAGAGDLVITQSLSFAATSNAIVHAGARPVFVDVDRDTLGLSPEALAAWLEQHCEMAAGQCRHVASGKRIAACLPMHSFGHPCHLDGIVATCRKWQIPLVEDAAEALGSSYHGQPCGTFGLMGTLSFNGNKICTTGGGGAIITNDAGIGRRAKHLTTTAKVPHRWRFYHDETGYNLRMPNLNAALGCAQLERLPEFVAFKRALAARYRDRFAAMGVPLVEEPAGTQSNYWLCAILVPDLAAREDLLALTNDNGVMTRPAWEPSHTLPMYRNDVRGPLPVTSEMVDRLVNIPSGFRSGPGA